MGIIFKKTILILSALVGFCGPMSVYASDNMAVFVPSLILDKPKENALTKALKDSGIQTVIFSKYTEFENYFEKFKPPYALCPAIACKELIKSGGVIHTIPGDGKPYSVLSTKKLIAADFSKLKWGMVQLGPRDSQLELLSEKLKNKIRFLKTVAKEDDLVPLLVFGTVDAILISNQGIQGSKGKFHVKLEEFKERIAISSEELYSNEKEPEGIKELLNVLKRELGQ